MKVVFDTKPESAYDDDIARWYHFPSWYLSIVNECLGDWVVFRQPRRGGGHMGYFAVARVVDIRADEVTRGHHYAFVTDFLPFDSVAPWREEGRYAESALRELPISQVGANLQGRSVRALTEQDFAEIVRRGLTETLEPANAIRLGLDYPSIDDTTCSLLSSVSENFERRVEQYLVNRKVRDAAFRANVCAAYEDRCAVTGLQIRNGGGRAEVQAAHIWPVSEGGPDTVQNGIALSATAHWLFDRHLISISDDYGLLVSHNKVPGEFAALFEKQSERIRLPKDDRLWPSRKFLEQHRDQFASA